MMLIDLIWQVPLGAFLSVWSWAVYLMVRETLDEADKERDILEQIERDKAREANRGQED